MYRGYRDFYGKPHDPAIFETVWGWLMDPAHETRGLIAEVAGTPVGIGHFRRFARPIDAAHGLYLDDLFTAEAARGSGAGGAILTRLAEIARDEGASLVRWITAESNATARRLYDRVAAQTPWVTYDLAPAS
nr:GNAT family N-acetyltransferase [Leucobacter luti]